MKKFVVFIASFLVSCSLWADHLGESMPSGYQIISSTDDSSLESGTARITGIVDIGASRGPAGVEISQGDETIGRTDAQGKFSLVIQVSKPVYFFVRDSSEVQIPALELPEKKKIEIHVLMPSTRPTAIRKPVIYLYSDAEIEANIKITPNGEITMAYPAYNDGWAVRTTSDGNIVDLSGSISYPYLFWEASTKNLTFQSNPDGSMNGSIVSAENVVEFLETSLARMGLNSREMTDFITYWAPDLIKNEYSFIQFLVDEEYEKIISTMEVNPAPESMLRVFMLFREVDADGGGIQPIPQQFSPLDRTGFTLIEWGGSQLLLTEKTP